MTDVIAVLPRLAPDQEAVPHGIWQMRPRRGRVAFALTAFAIAVTRKIDLVFCGHLYLVSLAAFIARLKGAKLLVQTHGIEAWPRPARLRRAAFETADLILCVSRYTRARVLSWAAIPPERLLVLPNTVEDIFTPGNASPLRAALGLEDKKILLTVARMDPRQQYKGQDLVISALPKVLADGHDVVYLIVGEGEDRARLETLAHEFGVGARVQFLGAVQREALIDIYRAADLFVMPSKGEGFGIAFLEAMATGTPTLALDVVGSPDALADGQLGNLVSEAELPGTISNLLTVPKPDPNWLSTQVRARFGRARFVENVRLTMETKILGSGDAYSTEARSLTSPATQEVT